MSKLHDVFTRPLDERGFAAFLLTKLHWAIVALFVLFSVSTGAYMGFEHYSLLDAAFMTVITLSTVGYGVVRPLDAVGRIITMGIIIASFATLAYAGAVVTSLFTTGEALRHLRKVRGRKMRRSMHNHVIVVGFGRVGQAVARGVVDLNRECLVMERNSDREAQIIEAGFVPMIGDATSETDLKEAGIDDAIALVAAAEEDATNLVVTLTARAVRPELRIISRVNEAAWQDRIERAGANVAQSPYRSYGISLASSAVIPNVMEMHTIAPLGLVTEEIVIPQDSPYINVSLQDLGARVHGVLLIGLRRDRQFQRWNEVSGVIASGDIVVALGSPEQVNELAKRASLGAKTEAVAKDR